MSSKAYKMLTGAVLSAAVFVLNFIPLNTIFPGLPQRIYVSPEGKAVLQANIPLTAKVSGTGGAVKVNGREADGSVVNLAQPIEISADDVGEAQLDFTVAGLFKIRSMTVKVEDGRHITPGGQSIGVVLYTQGALVISTGEITDVNGVVHNPGKDAGIRAGDVILAAGGQEVQDADHLAEIVNGVTGPLQLHILRGGEEKDVTITPAQDKVTNKHLLGLWVRDSTAGIGTMSYTDERHSTFGSLGHSITDVETQDEMLLKEGGIAFADVVGIVKGEEGTPGELTGAFLNTKQAVGRIMKNTEYGIFGTMFNDVANPLYPDGLEIAYQDEVHTGPAKLLTTIDDSGLRAFDCEIIRVTPQRNPSSKSMVVKITSSELLERTGGIVQGMSGSPIIQDGKIIGAVTHVFINDPQRGYGIFIEWMLNESDTIAE